MKFWLIILLGTHAPYIKNGASPSSQFIEFNSIEACDAAKNQVLKAAGPHSAVCAAKGFSNPWQWEHCNK